MRLDLAQQISIGDEVYNCFREKITVITKTEIYGLHKHLDRILLQTKDKNGYTQNYNHNDVYLASLEDECDEEISWIAWAELNKNLIVNADLPLLKEVYITAFANGFEYKRNITFQELMQK